MDRKRSLASIRKAVGLALLITGQALAVAVIQDVIAQALHMKLTAGSASIVLTSYTATVMISRLYFGQLTDRVGAKRLLLWSLVLMAVILCGYPLANGNPFALTVVRVLHGITYALVANTVFLVTRRSVSEKHQTRFSAFAGSCVTLSSGLGMTAGIWLANKYYLWHVVVALGITAAGMLYTGLALMDKTWVIVTQKTKSHGTRLFVLHSVKKVIHKKSFVLALPGLGGSAAYMSFYTWFTNSWELRSDLVLSMATVGTFTAAVTVMPRWAKSQKGYFWLMAGSNLLMVMCLLLFWQGDSLQIMIAAGFLLGVAVSAKNLGIVEAILMRVNHAYHGVATATAGFMVSLGLAIGTAYSSLMWGLVKEDMWLTMIPLLVLSLVLHAFIWKRVSKMDRIEIGSVRSQAALHLRMGERKAYFQLLQSEGIDKLDELPLLSPDENPRVLIGNVEDALELIAMVEVLDSTLPVDGPRFELSQLLLRLLSELESDELGLYAFAHYYERPKDINLRKFQEDLLQKARKNARDSLDAPLSETFMNIGAEHNVGKPTFIVKPDYLISDLLDAIEALGVVDVLDVEETYKKNLSMASLETQPSRDSRVFETDTRSHPSVSQFKYWDHNEA